MSDEEKDGKKESEDDVYKDSTELLDDDEIDAEEEGFMRGYDEAGESEEDEDTEPESEEE